MWLRNRKKTELAINQLCCLATRWQWRLQCSDFLLCQTELIELLQTYDGKRTAKNMGGAYIASNNETHKGAQINEGVFSIRGC